MKTSPHRNLGIKLAGVLALSVLHLRADTFVVDEFGDAGWQLGDTRASGYADVNGGSQLVLGRTRTDAPPLLEDTLVAARLAFTAGPAPATDPQGSLHITAATTADKATLENRSFSASLFDPTMQFEYRWFRTSGGVAAPALKIGIDTAETNPSGNTATDRGENRFDKILVYEPYLQGSVATPDNTWTIESIAYTSGKFWLVNLTASGALPVTNVADLRTLADWATAFDGAGQTGNVVSLQIGVGSPNPNQDSYVDFLSSGSGTAQTIWNFASVVPEPSSSLFLLGTGLPFLLRRRRASV
jgi:hypothetical protein